MEYKKGAGWVGGGVVRENDPDDEAFSEVSLFNAALEMMCKR